MKKLLCITLLLCFMVTPALGQEGKIVDYKVIYSEFVDEFESKVHTFMVLGWQPLGGVSTYGKDLMQTMVKYEED